MRYVLNCKYCQIVNKFHYFGLNNFSSLFNFYSEMKMWWELSHLKELTWMASSLKGERKTSGRRFVFFFCSYFYFRIHSMIIADFLMVLFSLRCCWCCYRCCCSWQKTFYNLNWHPLCIRYFFKWYSVLCIILLIFEKWIWIVLLFKLKYYNRFCNY